MTMTSDSRAPAPGGPGGTAAPNRVYPTLRRSALFGVVVAMCVVFPIGVLGLWSPFGFAIALTFGAIVTLAMAGFLATFVVLAAGDWAWASPEYVEIGLDRYIGWYHVGPKGKSVTTTRREVEYAQIDILRRGNSPMGPTYFLRTKQPMVEGLLGDRSWLTIENGEALEAALAKWQSQTLPSCL